MPSKSDSPQPIDIVTRLRQTRADMIGTADEGHYFDCHEAAAEIARLRLWTTLTDAEREALERGIGSLDGVEDLSADATAMDAKAVATLRGLLKRMRKVAQ
jgi:hypothetical protein